MAEGKSASVGSIHVPVDRFYVFISIISVLCFGGSIAVFLATNSSSSPYVAGILFALSLLLGFFGFKNWIEEEEEEKDLRSKRRKLEEDKLEYEREMLKRKKDYKPYIAGVSHKKDEPLKNLKEAIGYKE